MHSKINQLHAASEPPPQKVSRTSTFSASTPAVPLQKCRSVTPSVFLVHAHQCRVLQDASASIAQSQARGAGSPSSGSWRSYTTTLMTYQHSHRSFPAPIKPVWTRTASNPHTLQHRRPGLDPVVPRESLTSRPAEPHSPSELLLFATWFQNCGKFNFYLAV